MSGTSEGARKAWDARGRALQGDGSNPTQIRGADWSKSGDGFRLSPEAEKVADQKLRELEKHQSTSPAERAVAINADTGEVYYDVTGGKVVRDGLPLDGVDLSSDLGAARSREAGDNKVLAMHTHPGDGDASHSDGDWMSFTWGQEGSSVVVTRNSIFTLTKTPAYDAVPPLKRTPAAVRRRWNEIIDGMTAEAGSWTVDGVIRDTNIQLARELGVSFTERKRA